MLQQDKPEDFVIATGESNTLADFVAAAFEVNGFDWQRHVDISPVLYRPTDIDRSLGNPSKAAEVFGWCASYQMRDVVKMMSRPNHF